MANNSTNSQRPRCSFCGKDSSLVERLVAGPGVYICNECVDLCNRILEDEGYFDNASEPGKPGRGSKRGKDMQVRLMLPSEMKQTLDDYVIGQERAKRAMCVA